MKTRLVPHGTTTLPTKHGLFQCYAFQDDIDGCRKEAVALVRGVVMGQRGVLVRPHSQCLTGEVFWSLKCDCREQFEYAIDMINQHLRGAIIYVLEEGRGIGLMEKIRAYSLQEQGMDTIDSNIAIGQEIDNRKFSIESKIIQALGIESVQLLTNNPQKIKCITEYGVVIDNVVNIPVQPNHYSYSYLYTKKMLMGHQLHDLGIPPTVHE